MQGEFELGPHGGLGGAPFELSCLLPDRVSFATGLAVRSGTQIDRIAIRCLGTVVVDGPTGGAHTDIPGLGARE